MSDYNGWNQPKHVGDWVFSPIGASYGLLGRITKVYTELFHQGELVDADFLSTTLSDRYKSRYNKCAAFDYRYFWKLSLQQLITWKLD